MHKTLVKPNSINTDPSACTVYPLVILTVLSASNALDVLEGMVLDVEMELVGDMDRVLNN